MSVFTIIFVIVDIIDHLDKFIDSEIPTHDILRYYFHTIPWFISIGLPMALLLSTVFTFGLLQRRNEITAIKASGISIRRISLSLLIVGVVVSILSFYFDNLVVTTHFQKRTEIEEQYFRKSRSHKKIKKIDIYRQIEKDKILVIKQFSYKSNAAYNISIQQFDDGNLIFRLDAPVMEWDQNLEKWKLKDFNVRKWENEKLLFSHFSSDTLINVNFSPVDLTKESVKPEEMNYWELAGFVEKLKLNGIKDPRWAVNLHFKTAFACTSFIMILFGLSLSIGKPRSNMAVGMGISIFVILLYYAVLKFGQSLGYKSIASPFVSVWFGNFIFIILGIYLFRKTRT